MNRFFAGYAAAAIAMLVLDMLWLGLIARSAYRSGIGHLMAPRPDLLASGAFYLLYPLGLLIFVLAPQADSPAWSHTLSLAALFGFFAYATYDLSNLATLRGWPASLAMLDLAWGTALTTACAAAGKGAMRLVAPA